MALRLGRMTASAGLLALALLVTSWSVGPSAHADGPTAAFWGYVVPGSGASLPQRVRAVSERGAVCGSADVTPTAIPGIGFYALVVVSDGVKSDCPVAGERVAFTMVYGAIDEGFAATAYAPFRPGETTTLHLTRDEAGLR